MNRSQMCVANVQYKKPTDGGRQKGLLRYLTYREGRHGPAIQETGLERWHDRGLGKSIADIARLCEQYKSDHVLAFTLVFNSNPELMAMVPVEQREAFVCELTETTLNRFFEVRGLDGGIEHSYVIHHRDSENPEAPGLHDPHTHVILPGTVFDEGEGERTPLYFSRNKKENHIELLHEVTEGVMTGLMDRYVGPDWEQRYDAVEAVREQQRQVVEGEPHGGIVDEHDRTWSMWFGTRRTDEQTTAVGYYRYFPTDPNNTQPTIKVDDAALEFRPVAAGLNHDRAEDLARKIGDYAQRHPETSPADLIGLIQHIGSLSPEEQDSFPGRTPMQPEVAAPDEERTQPDHRGLSIDF